MGLQSQSGLGFETLMNSSAVSWKDGPDDSPLFGHQSLVTIFLVTNSLVIPCREVRLNSTIGVTARAVGAFSGGDLLLARWFRGRERGVGAGREPSFCADGAGCSHVGDGVLRRVFWFPGSSAELKIRREPGGTEAAAGWVTGRGFCLFWFPSIYLLRLSSLGVSV